MIRVARKFRSVLNLPIPRKNGPYRLLRKNRDLHIGVRPPADRWRRAKDPRFKFRFTLCCDLETPGAGDSQMKTFTKALVNFVKKEDGPTAVEYAVMLALIVVVCIAAITTLGSNANSTFSFVGSSIQPPSSTTTSSS